jgi:hypothetical protein|tara:strand:- start:612 stop:1508 length:897 start_codon:yes stop_codon:yes gene_type:complete
MAFVVADRVKETTTTTGTGTITLAGAEPNFVTFTSVLSDGDTTYYAIVDDTNTAFEVGLGTFTASGTTLARTTVLASSNSGSAVNLQAGTKDVFINYPAGKSVFLNASNQLVINGTAVTSTAAELNILDGVTATATEINYLDITTLGTSEASKAVTADANAKVKFIGTTSVAEMIEKVTTQTSTTGTINFDLLTQAVEFYTANQGGNRTINFRGDGSTPLNSVMATGESMTVAILMTQGSSAYYLDTYKVDSSSVTPEWSGGSAPSSGNANSIDSYIFTFIKTADSTFTVLASQTQYA